MKTALLHENKNSKDLILFFGGFASKAEHFSHLKSDKNVLMIYDYRNFNLSLNLTKFENITLIAFSMGVAVASRLLKQEDFRSKIAINGTNFGIDKKRGIHPAIFTKSAKNFNALHFKRALFGEGKNLELENEALLKAELEALQEFLSKVPTNEAFTWDKVFLSKGDAVFPNEALKSCFSDITPINSPHFVFFAFESWDLLR